MFKLYTRWMTAAKAGWIASRCKYGCVIDDEEECIIPCWIHRRVIGELLRQNEAAQ